MTKRLRLNSKSPTSIKLDKLCALAEELKISISFGAHYVIINDEERDENLPTLYLEDIEEGHTISEFPPCTEFKMVYDDPVSLAEEKKERQDRFRKEAEEKAALAKAREEKEKARQLEAAARLEESERKQLAILKCKYPDE